MILNASMTCLAVAPPPTSRKLAGLPPWNWMMSMVAMARPAPFTARDQCIATAARIGTKAADAAVQLDVVEVVLRGLDLGGGLLRCVAQREDVWLPEARVLVKVELGVHAHDAIAVVQRERVDLDEACVMLRAYAHGSTPQHCRTATKSWYRRRNWSAAASRCSAGRPSDLAILTAVSLLRPVAV